MPLNAPGLQSAIAEITNPSTRAEAAQAWADAMGSYAAGIVPPSTTVSSAASTLSAALTAAMSSSDPATTASALESAFAAFAAAVGAGMVGYTPLPPPGSVGFLGLVSTNKASMEAAALDWSSAIDSWMRTGTATLIAPPNTVVPWS